MDLFDETNLDAEELLGMGETCTNCGKSRPTHPTGYGPMCDPCDEDFMADFANDESMMIGYLDGEVPDW